MLKVVEPANRIREAPRLTGGNPLQVSNPSGANHLSLTPSQVSEHDRASRSRSIMVGERHISDDADVSQGAI